jgi:putative membrane protein
MKQGIYSSVMLLALASPAFSQSGPGHPDMHSTSQPGTQQPTSQGTTGSSMGSSSSSGTGSSSMGSSSQGSMGNSTGSMQRSTDGSMVDSGDKDFVNQAAQGGMTEVALSKLAEQRASNAQVKSFAQQMVKDHTKANQELTSLAGRKSITVSSRTLEAGPNDMAADANPGTTGQQDPGSGSPSGTLTGQTLDKAKSDAHGEHQAKMDKLSKLSGAEFDREYMRCMLEDHDRTIALFRRQADQGKDRDLKAFAAKTLPTLTEHNRMAQRIATSVGAAAK